ncbi:MAG: NAD(P)H-dependent oxidoreductase subunit E [Mogibacterium sp.]|nr:NAD(P)H-dependent oxidoreductase subunit E [Bacillota bacterium]MBQ3291427.1 NAD(P)H-dependent oxidoreductase subunit E [Mogibacterium sp.]
MKVSSVPFKGTKEQEAKLLEVIAKYKGQKGALMPIMQEAQEIYGYLPYQVQKIISDETGIPIEKIYGVATFYAQFSMSPKGKYVVAMCLGTACYVKGAGAILEEIEKVLGIEDGECTSDGKFSLEVCRCVGACGLAPVMIVDGDVYGKMTPDRVAGVLSKYE